MGGGACAWGVLGGVGACGPVTSLGSGAPPGALGPLRGLPSLQLTGPHAPTPPRTHSSGMPRSAGALSANWGSCAVSSCRLYYQRRYHTQVSDTPCVQPALDETTCTGCLTPP